MRSATLFNGVQHHLQARAVDSARTAQAGVISAFDRLLSSGPAEGKLVGLALHLQLDVLALVIGQPAVAVDRQYRFVAGLLELHREFAQRLFDVVEGPDVEAPVTHSDPGLAPVVHLRARGGRAGR